MVACDVYRPAAIDQLGIVAEQVGAALYEDREEKDPVKIALAALELPKRTNMMCVLLIPLVVWLLMRY